MKTPKRRRFQLPDHWDLPQLLPTRRALFVALASRTGDYDGAPTAYNLFVVRDR